MAELKDNQGYIEVRDGEFVSGDGLKLLDTSKISDSVVYSFKLYNNYKAEKNVNVFMGVFYDGKLAGVKTLPVAFSGRGESDALTIGYADALPEGKFEKISVKVLVWDKDTLVPFTDRIDMYSQDSRAVKPEAFGKDTTEPVVVAFMGDSITHTAAQLAEGVNIATVATNPGYVQSKTVYDLVTSKMAKDYALRDIAFVERYIVSYVDSLSDVEACITCLEERYSEETAARFVNYPDNKRAQQTIISEIATLEDQAKEAAQPKEYTVQIIKQ